MEETRTRSTRHQTEDLEAHFPPTAASVLFVVLLASWSYQLMHCSNSSAQPGFGRSSSYCLNNFLDKARKIMG